MSCTPSFFWLERPMSLVRQETKMQCRDIFFLKVLKGYFQTACSRELSGHELRGRGRMCNTKWPQPNSDQYHKPLGHQGTTKRFFLEYLHVWSLFFKWNKPTKRVHRRQPRLTINLLLRTISRTHDGYLLYPASVWSIRCAHSVRTGLRCSHGSANTF